MEAMGLRRAARGRPEPGGATGARLLGHGAHQPGAVAGTPASARTHAQEAPREISRACPKLFTK